MMINMNQAQLKRRFNADGYVGKINEFERTITDGK